MNLSITRYNRRIARRVVRVVYGESLLNSWGRKAPTGSNPVLSATWKINQSGTEAASKADRPFVWLEFDSSIFRHSGVLNSCFDLAGLFNAWNAAKQNKKYRVEYRIQRSLQNSGRGFDSLRPCQLLLIEHYNEKMCCHS